MSFTDNDPFLSQNMNSNASSQCYPIFNPDTKVVLEDENNRAPKEDTLTPFWCQIYFYQFDHRLESFKGYGTEITIDGLCAPSDSSRFCLGIKGTIVANPVAETARRQIGDGCKLQVEGADVRVLCLSDSPIFIQCPLYAASFGDHLATVYRLSKNQSLCIFNNEKFTELLHSYKQKSYMTLLSLQNMCHIRISFVKGWGEYYRRRTITTTPCWVEVFLTEALERLDGVLVSVESSERASAETASSPPAVPPDGLS
ncbi:MH2 domain-containing protein [Aphelenchoides bicaudatus]|nr:MH2 domain-containing protein [Aphelenchoides bicaudatus]